jgi:hypothetical protein
MEAPFPFTLLLLMVGSAGPVASAPTVGLSGQTEVRA